MRFVTYKRKEKTRTKIELDKRKISPFKLAVPLLFSLFIAFSTQISSKHKNYKKITNFQSIDSLYNINELNKALTIDSVYLISNEKIKYWKDFFEANQDVDKAIERISKRNEFYKEQFASLASLIDEEIKVIFNKNNINLFDLLTSIEITESYGDTNCISKVRAIGPYQLMLKYYNITEDEAKNPLTARKICFNEIIKYIKMFGNTETPIEFALAAYNYGPNNIKRLINKYHQNNFWKLLDYLPKETKNYVPKVLSLYNLINETELASRN